MLFSYLFLLIEKGSTVFFVCEESPARAKPIISLDSSNVLARYTDHGLCFWEPRSLTPAMPVREERATAGGLNTHPHAHGHALPCDVPLFLRQSPGCSRKRFTSLNGKRRRERGSSDYNDIILLLTKQVFKWFHLANIFISVF